MMRVYGITLASLPFLRAGILGIVGLLERLEAGKAKAMVTGTVFLQLILRHSLDVCIRGFIEYPASTVGEYKTCNLTYQAS